MEINLERLKNITDLFIFLRGESYFNDGRAKILDIRENVVAGIVYGSKEYSVKIKQKGEQILVKCTCPYFLSTHSVCKHIVATALEYERLRKLQEAQNRGTWKELLTPERTAHNKTAKTRLVFKFWFYTTSWQIEPVVKYIKKDGSLGHERKLNYNHIYSPEVLASSTEQLALKVLQNFTRYSNSVNFQYGSEYGFILKYLKDTPLYYISKNREEIPIKFLKDSFNLIYTIEKVEKKYLLKLYLEDENTGHRIPINDQFLLLSSGDVYFFHNMKIWHAKQNLAKKMLMPFCKTKQGLEIPEHEFSDFLLRIYPLLKSENVHVELPADIHVNYANNLVRKALYLTEAEGKLHITVSFFYSNNENTIEPVEVNALPFEKIQMKIRDNQNILVSRQYELENYYLNILDDHHLIRENAEFVLPQKVDALNWLFDVLPILAEKGFEIYGEDKLDKLKVRRVTPKIISQVSTGTDWFDLNVEIDFEGLRMSYKEVMKSLKKNTKFIRLNDGSAVKINEKILKNLGLIHAFSRQSTKDRIRFSKTQALIIAEIVNNSDRVKTDKTFKAHLKKLKNFTRIRPVELPRHFQGELRPYQKSGLDWLAFLNEYGFGGCLADDMGLGKTVQALALLQLQKEKLNKNLVSLIVAPTSVISNWQREASRFTPQLKIYMHYGADRTKEIGHFKQFDLIITSYALLWRDFELLKEMPFYYIILDESQKIKNPLSVTAKAAYQLKASHRLVMTGTPIENNLTELWAQFQFINPGMLGSLNAFNNYFGKAIEKDGDAQKAEQLRKLIYPFILRRTKEMVVKELPPKIENILFCNMTGPQEKTYEKWRDYYRAVILKAIDEKGLNRSKMKVLEGLTRLRQLAVHPAMVDRQYHQNSGKFEALEDMLEDVIRENHKVLIFSQFVKALSLVRKKLDARELPYLYMDGRTRKRQELVDQFQQNEQIKIFLISLKAGGLGLNLTAADYVIHLDPWWNPAVESQAMDRAHRIGQTKKVFVYKLITKGTVEEKILELQRKKQKLSRQLITTDAAFFKNLNKEDILHLFS